MKMKQSAAAAAGDEELIRRGPWTVEEDFTLVNYIARHGEGRWNSLATCAGLKRSGKSCRLRWLNYMRPDVRRGNITLQEQLLILQLHLRWGNRWSKIAQHLPGRTDNEIKNYWRTRVQKHAKQLKCDVNSKKFKDAMHYLWIPRLVERIQAAAAGDHVMTTTMISSDHDFDNNTITMCGTGAASEQQNIISVNVVSSQPENSVSSESFESYNNYTMKQQHQHQGIDNYSNNHDHEEYCCYNLDYYDQPQQQQQQPYSSICGDHESVVCSSPTAVNYFDQMQGTSFDTSNHFSDVDCGSLWNIDDIMWF